MFKDFPPAGSLLETIEHVTFFAKGSGVLLGPYNKLILVTGYSKLYTDGKKDQKNKFNVEGIIDGKSVVSSRRFSISDMDRSFKLIEHGEAINEQT